MYKYILLVCGLILMLMACDDDSYETNPNFKLQFSTDTVAFDTLITGKIATTQQLKIYNRSNHKIKISEMKLQQTNSPYQLNINGKSSTIFSDIAIASKDSLFVFIAINLPDKKSNKIRLLEDKLLLNINNNTQNVVLQTWALDVIRINNNISKSTTWEADKSYLISKDIAVEKGIDLNIMPGVRVLFEKKSSLTIDGTLKVMGTFKNPILFRSTRFEELYDHVPSQWNGIFLSKHSTNNTLKHFKLQHSTQGLKCATKNITLEYGYIADCTENAITLNNCNLKMHNMLIVNCGGAGVKSIDNGDITIHQSTFYNAWSFGGRATPIIDISKNNIGNIAIGNCIIWGNNYNEIALASTKQSSIKNSLIKITDSQKQSYKTIFDKCIFNQSPKFKEIEKYNFQLQDKSPCIGSGSTTISSFYPFNFAGEKNNSNNMGCY